MAISFENWHEMLIRVAPDPKDLACSHSWICRRKGKEEQRVYHVLENQELVGSYNNDNKKLSFKKIHNISREVFSETEQAIQKSFPDLKTTILEVLKNEFRDEDKKIECLENANKLLISLSKIHAIEKILLDMLDRAPKKRSYKQFKGVFDTIKKFFWHIFCNNSKRLQLRIIEAKIKHSEAAETYIRFVKAIDLSQYSTGLPTSLKTVIEKLKKTCNNYDFGIFWGRGGNGEVKAYHIERTPPPKFY